MTWTWHDDDPATALSAQNMQNHVELRLRALEVAGGGGGTVAPVAFNPADFFTPEDGFYIDNGTSYIDGDYVVISADLSAYDPLVLTAGVSVLLGAWAEPFWPLFVINRQFGVCKVDDADLVVGSYHANPVDGSFTFAPTTPHASSEEFAWEAYDIRFRLADPDAAAAAA